MTSGTPTSAPVVRDTQMQVSPNPFNPRTTVSLTLARRGAVTLQVFDVRGRLVRTLHRGDLDAGPHELAWDGRDDGGATLASGVYLVRAELQDRELREKVLLVK